MRTAAEAVVKTLAGAHGKGRGLFIVERATRLEFTARFFELNAFADNLDDIRASDQVVDKILRYQSGHIEVNGSSGVPGLFEFLLFRLA
jgi:hypothetical protein